MLADFVIYRTNIRQGTSGNMACPCVYSQAYQPRIQKSSDVNHIHLPRSPNHRLVGLRWSHELPDVNVAYQVFGTEPPVWDGGLASCGPDLRRMGNAMASCVICGIGPLDSVPWYGA